MLKLTNVKFSREAALVLFLIFAASMADSKACSIGVNNNYQKNLLVAQAANELGIGLTSVTSTAVSAYGYETEGSAPVTECPLYFISRAHVSFEYSPAAGQNCSASIDVQMRDYMGEDLPDGPLFEVTSSNAELACSTSLSRIRVKIPLKRIIKFPPIKKPIIRQ